MFESCRGCKISNNMAKKKKEAPVASLHEGTSLPLKDLRVGHVLVCSDGRKRKVLSIDPVVDPINGAPKPEALVALDDGPGRALQELVADTVTVAE